MIPLSKPKNPKSLPSIIFGAFGLCLFGNIITTYIDVLVQSLFDYDIQMPEMPDIPDNALGLFLYFLSTAVVPALVEEFALRGVIMQPLRRYGDTFAILASAVIFGLMHCNLMQIPFAMIAGAAIGYAVIATESIWTGIIIHFLNNGFSVLVSVISAKYPLDSTEYAVCNVLFYLFIGLGIVLTVLHFKKYKTSKLKTTTLINMGKDFIGPVPFMSAKVGLKDIAKSYFLTAPMAIALLAVIYQTALSF